MEETTETVGTISIRGPEVPPPTVAGETLKLVSNADRTAGLRNRLKENYTHTRARTKGTHTYKLPFNLKQNYQQFGDV